MAIAEVSVIPLGTGTPSVSKYVARAVSVLRQEKDVKYELTSMGTIIEGDLEKILRVVKKMHQATFDEGAVRVITTIKIDERRDKPSTMSGKIGSLLKELER
jgi:uncharacterized protein (TIGR00106 family)